MSLNYAVRITRPNGKRTHVQLEVGTDATVPEATRWDVDVPSSATPDDVRRIVEDLNRREPPAVGFPGILGLKAQHIPAFAALQNLVDVTLASVDDAGLRELSQHAELEDIGVLDAEEVTDAGLAHLGSLTTLRHLEFVVSGKITDKGIESLARCTELEQLSLGENQDVSSRGAQILLGLPKLRELTLVSRKLRS